MASSPASTFALLLFLSASRGPGGRARRTSQPSAPSQWPTWRSTASCRCWWRRRRRSPASSCAWGTGEVGPRSAGQGGDGWASGWKAAPGEAAQRRRPELGAAWPCDRLSAPCPRLPCRSLRSFSQSPESVNALVDAAPGSSAGGAGGTGGGLYRVSARYLAAADGTRGATRQQLGIGMGGPGAIQHLINIHFVSPEVRVGSVGVPLGCARQARLCSALSIAPPPACMPACACLHVRVRSRPAAHPPSLLATAGPQAAWARGHALLRVQPRRDRGGGGAQHRQWRIRGAGACAGLYW